MSRRILALTFDDGPYADTTLPILDLLAQYHVKASFFAVGENITPETAPILRRAAEMGCEIASHSFSHRDMTQLTAAQIETEMQAAAARITAVTGTPPRFFRPPYLAVSDAMFAQIPLPFIGGYGVRDFEESVTAEMRAEGVLRQAKDGGIILLHDAENNFRTVAALRQIIPALLDAGFTLVTVSELFAEKGVTPAHTDRRLYSYAEQTAMYAEDAK